MSTSTTTPIQSHCSSGISNSHSITAGTISYHVKGQTNGDMGRWREKDTNLDQKKVFFRTVQSPLVSVYVTAPSSGLFFDSCPRIHICPGTCSS